MRRRSSPFRLFRTLLILIGLVFFSSSCFQDNEIWKPSEVGKLALRLESKYKRELFNNNYSLHFAAIQPNTVVVRVRYYPDADIQMIYTVINQAETLIKKTGQEEFNLVDVRVKVEMKKIDRPAKK